MSNCNLDPLQRIVAAQQPTKGNDMNGKIAILGCVAAAAAALALPASSPANDDDIERAGQCTGSTRSEIKVKPDDGRLEVEFEVDQNRSGVPWKVKIKDNGNVVVRETARTAGPSGSFSIERKIADAAGTDQITGIARNKRSGERCAAKVSV
jgi:hypothetical protein